MGAFYATDGLSVNRVLSNSEGEPKNCGLRKVAALSVSSEQPI